MRSNYMGRGKYFPKQTEKPFPALSESRSSQIQKSIETKSDDIVVKQKPNSRVFIWKLVLEKANNWSRLHDESLCRRGD